MKEEQENFARPTTCPPSRTGANPFDKGAPTESRIDGFDPEREEEFDEPDQDTELVEDFREAAAGEESVEDLLPGNYNWEHAEPAMPWQETDTEENSASREWVEEGDYVEVDAQSRDLPLGLILVGVFALPLVMIVTWNGIQQRSAALEEITQLRAQLASAALPQEVETSRSALMELNAENTGLVASLDALRLENARLLDRVGGLEAQIRELQAVRAVYEQAGVASPPPAAPEPTPDPAPDTSAPVRPAAQTPPGSSAPADERTGDDWFVNFGSYSKPATARSWAENLAPSAGSVIVAETFLDGSTLYRVRVVELPDRAAAEEVAVQLTATHGLPKLWIGRRQTRGSPTP